jgi:dUTP pyrophosphatase
MAKKKTQNPHPHIHPDPTTTIQLLSPKAKMPMRATPNTAGFDVYSTVTCALKPNTINKLPLDITIAPPTNTYIQIQSRSSLALKGLIVYAGVIDPDYWGNITVLLHNNSTDTHQINEGDQIAQLIFLNITMPVFLTPTWHRLICHITYTSAQIPSMTSLHYPSRILVNMTQ